MRTAVPVLLVLTVLAGGIVPAMAIADPGLAGAAPLAQATTVSPPAEPLSPGPVLAGTIGAQHAELDGAVEQRAFALRIAAGGGNQTRARILASVQRELQNRTTELERQQRQLGAARQNGTLSEARYQGTVTGLVTRARMLELHANQTLLIADSLPAEALDEAGVNVTALEQARTRARLMTGPEVDSIARRLAGPSVGQPYGPPRHAPGGPGPGPMDGGPRTTSPRNNTTTPVNSQSNTDLGRR